MNTIKLPIRFKSDTSEMETFTENTDEYFSNLIGLTIQIAPASLPISTFYGVDDPTFENSSVAKVGGQIAALIPDVDILEVSSTPSNNGVNTLAIKFSRKP